MKRYYLVIDSEKITKKLLTMCGVVFMLFAFVNVFFFKEYLLCLFTPEHLFSTDLYDHIRPLLYCGYYLILIAGNLMIGISLTQKDRNKRAMILGIRCLLLSILTEIAFQVSVFLHYRGEYTVSLLSDDMLFVKGLVALLLLWGLYLAFLTKGHKMNCTLLTVACIGMGLFMVASCVYYMKCGYGYHLFRYIDFDLSYPLYRVRHILGAMRIIASVLFGCWILREARWHLPNKLLSCYI